MRLLITGSKGLIGTALSHALRNLGIDVLGIDIGWKTDHPEYGSILDTDLLQERMTSCDGILHLGAVSRVITGEKNPKLCWETNATGTKNVVEAAQKSEKKPWILYASSREVYGQQDHLPVSEAAPLKPVNIYGESKVEAENIIQNAHKHELNTSIVRFSNVYGSTHDHTDRVIPAFCRAAVEGTEIRVEGKGLLFDFTYIEDVIQGVLAMIHLLSKNKPFPPIHLASGKSSSLEEIAEIAYQASQSGAQIIPGTPRSFDVDKFCGDPKRSKEILGWSARVDVEEGMKRLIRQYHFIFDGLKEASEKPISFKNISANCCSSSTNSI